MSGDGPRDEEKENIKISQFCFFQKSFRCLRDLIDAAPGSENTLNILYPREVGHVKLCQAYSL